MPVKLLTPLAAKIGGGVILALLIALGLMWAGNKSLSARLADTQEALVLEQAKLTVSNASIAALDARLQEMVQAGELTQERLEEAQEDVAEQTAPLRAQADALEAGEIDISEVEGL